jgi:hypothetical protein
MHLITIIFSTLLLIGCGEEKTEETPSEENSSTIVDGEVDFSQIYIRNISGLVIDGYIEGATAFVDLNGDGEFSEGEPTALSDENGSFSIDFDSNISSDQTPTLIASGGVDSETGRKYEGTLKSPLSSSTDLNVTPISTLITEYIANGDGETLETAKNMVAEKFNLPPEKLFQDPVKLAESGDTDLLKSAWQIEQGVALLKSAGNSPDQIFALMSQTIKDMPPPPSENRGAEDMFSEMFQKEEAPEMLGNSVDLSGMALSMTQNIDSLFKDIDYSNPDDRYKISFAVSENSEAMKGAIVPEEGGGIRIEESSVQLIEGDEFKEFDYKEVIVRDVMADMNLSEEEMQEYVEMLSGIVEPRDSFEHIQKKVEDQNDSDLELFFEEVVEKREEIYGEEDRDDREPPESDEEREDPRLEDFEDIKEPDDNDVQEDDEPKEDSREEDDPEDQNLEDGEPKPDDDEVEDSSEESSLEEDDDSEDVVIIRPDPNPIIPEKNEPVIPDTTQPQDEIDSGEESEPEDENISEIVEEIQTGNLGLITPPSVPVE